MKVPKLKNGNMILLMIFFTNSLDSLHAIMHNQLEEILQNLHMVPNGSKIQNTSQYTFSVQKLNELISKHLFNIYTHIRINT